jgi:hypothetical protein
MNRLYDPAILALPHPMRIDVALGRRIEESLLAQMGVLEAVRPYLAGEGAPTEWLINEVPGMLNLGLAALGAPGSVNLGVLVLMLARARLRAHGDPILQVAPALQAQLAATDLEHHLPARFFRCPWPVAYVELARPSDLCIYNRASGLHAVEGAYIGGYRVPPYSRLYQSTERVRLLGLDPARAMRIIELTLTGSPAGKRDALDDASQDLVLFIQDEDADLDTLLARHVAYYGSPAARSHPGFELPSPDEIAQMTAVVSTLAKVLLYLHLPDAEQTRVAERSDLERRLRQVRPKKAARLQRQWLTAYDRIVLGPRDLPTATAMPAPDERDDGSHRRSPRPHWRRGHFRRIRCGEGLRDSRLGWIRPVLVNAAEAFGPVRTEQCPTR